MSTLTTPRVNPAAQTLPLFGHTKDTDFDREHPGVYREFRAIAMQTRAAGFKHYSARTIIHVMRHHSGISMGPAGQFKIDNRVSPYLARRLAKDEPDLADFFEFRRSNEDE